MTDNMIPDDIFRATTMPTEGKRVLILTADNTEDTEFFYPYYRFLEAGCRVDVATPDGESFKGKNGSGLEETMAIADIDATVYDLLYIPGGKAPAALKKDDEAVALVKTFAATGKPIAAICHGPQLLAEANLIQGRNLAAWPDVADELKDAGATFVNQPTVADKQFITGRWPGDLPSFTAKALQAIGVGQASSTQRQAA